VLWVSLWVKGKPCIGLGYRAMESSYDKFYAKVPVGKKPHHLHAQKAKAAVATAGKSNGDSAAASWVEGPIEIDPELSAMADEAEVPNSKIFQKPEDAHRLIQSYVDRYNTLRLHSAIGYVTPRDMLAGRQAEIHAARDRKLEDARRQRQVRRQRAMPSRFARSGSAATRTAPGETEAGAAGTQPC
jgi:hypothetical protein